MIINKISERTKENTSACVGVPFERITDLSQEEEIRLVAQKYGREIVFSKRRNNSGYTGNPLLTKRRIRTLQDVEKKIKKVR